MGIKSKFYTRYYNADKAQKDAEVNKAKRADENFDDMVNQFKPDFDFMMDKIKKSVENGNMSVTIMPLSEEEQEYYENSTKIVPDSKRVQPDGRKRALGLLKLLGYVTNCSTEKYYVRPDLKQDFEVIHIS